MNHFFVTIDTECDMGKGWVKTNPITFKNITEDLPNKLNPLFNKYDIKPTYLISPEVLNDKQSMDILNSFDDCELGTHLHPESVEPEKLPNSAGAIGTEFPCNLKGNLEYEKLKTITELFKEKTGYYPTSYRAGRYGVNTKSFDNLIKLGYKVDSSVTPGIDWSRYGGPNFKYYSEKFQPYKYKELLEVPITITNKRLPFLPDKWFYYKWLRPSFMTSFELNLLMANMLRKEGHVLNMMFHSSEFILGSPCSRNKLMLNLLFKRLEKSLLHAYSLDVEFITLKDYEKVYR